MTEKVQKIYEKLKEEYPDVHCELNYETPLQLLVATVLSAQTTVSYTHLDVYKRQIVRHCLLFRIRTRRSRIDF